MTPAAKLLKWYRQYGRDLPWRRTRNPYRILVSEIMLQQTQVERVKIFYRSWLKQFPNWKALASASNASVIKAWSGLGYNRRALVLRDVARDVVKKGVPKTEQDWIALKGIGPYTSAAVSAFAQKKRTMPIDTNIRRVLGRLLFGITFPQLKEDDRIRRKIDSFLPTCGHFYDVPQAIFDLATTICTKDPDCANCPLRNDCKAASKFLSGRVRIPKRSIAKSHEKIHRNKCYPDRIYRGRILKLVGGQKIVKIADIGATIDSTYNQDLDQAWVNNMIERLVRDQMIQKKRNQLSL